MIGAFLLSDNASACKAEKVKTKEEGGFIFRVVGGSDKVEAKKEPGSKETAFPLELLAPYFVTCAQGQFYKITDLSPDTASQGRTGRVGYVLKEQVHPWPTREALNFSAVAFTGERPEIVAWDDESILKKFLDTGNQKLAPPAFREDLESTLKRERATRPYPVLSSKVQLLRNTVEKRVYNVLVPVAVPPETKVVIDAENKLDKVMTSANFVIVFDATNSMAPFASQLASDLRESFSALPSEIADASSIGFVFFRGERDAEKFAILPQTSVPDAMKVLTEAATPRYMRGGGGSPAPVLDAVYIAHHLFPWKDNQQDRRVLLVVLGHDAKPLTTGKIHDGVPPGLEPAKIASDLRDDGIQVVTVQAGPESGRFLIPVLTTLAETTRGVFVEWGAGGDKRRPRVVAAVARQLSERAETTFKEGKKDLAALEFDYRGYATIPLKILDREKLQRLRNAGVKFNLDPGAGGVLIREGFILENYDILEPQVQIDKQTLDNLIALFSALGVAGVDVQAMQESAARALAAIAGEGYDPKETIEALIKRRLGIQFRTRLLYLNLEYLAGMNRSERLEMTKRIQNAGTVLSQFLEANLDELQKNQKVWMPVAKLP